MMWQESATLFSTYLILLSQLVRSQSPYCTNDATIPHSNISHGSKECIGKLGEVCAYQCDKGFVPIGRHVCQTYQAGGKTFLNATWFGGRCQPLCDQPEPCQGYMLRWRSTRAHDQCLHTECFASKQQLLKHVARSAYQVFQLSRSNISGLYSDHVDLVRNSVGRDAATGVTGLGLMAEVIADAMGWMPRAVQQQKILLTLRTMNGRTPNVAYPRSAEGFAVHFLDRDSGAAHDVSSCMMCTGLQMAGVNFARNFYFLNDPHSQATREIVALSEQLWNSTQFYKLLCDAETGAESVNGTGIPMIQQFTRTCSAVQYPQADGFYEFNEEHYTVWFASLQGQQDSFDPTLRAALNRMWSRWQGRRNNPNHAYQSHPLLSMWSGYLVQLPYYTTASFNTDTTFKNLFRSHWLADWDYYNRTTHQGDRGRYGLGAGTTPTWCTGGSGYYADRIGQGTSDCRMISPYITIGYMPNDPDMIQEQVVQLLEDGDTALSFYMDNTTHHILWRASMLDYKWMQGYGVTMVDFSSELFGLSTLWLSQEFFSKYSARPQ